MWVYLPAVGSGGGEREGGSRAPGEKTSRTRKYAHQINHLLPSKLPVRQNGCVKEAEGVK